MQYRVRLAAAGPALPLARRARYYDLVVGKQGARIDFTPGGS